MGLGYALTTATTFQVLIKWIIGGIRPNFLATCQPQSSGRTGQGWDEMMFDRSICKTPYTREVDEALMSFPSGHSSAAFAGFVFLALYINAKYKVFANFHSAHWQLILFSAPILIATLIAASKTIDYWHHWYDCVAGAIIGTFFAFWGYRMVYASIWDYRSALYPPTNCYKSHTQKQNQSHPPPIPRIKPS